MWAGLFYAFRFAARLWASYLTYLRSMRLVAQALSLLSALGTALRSLPVVGRLKVAGKPASVLKQALRPFNAEAMTKLGNTRFANFAKPTGYVYGGRRRRSCACRHGTLQR
ncbi:hypothetical protein ACIBHX_08740 [Nonomuraea sp. NPDC050536]|uniref:hypothetical protein n=1 Tax=Nonomuraea sp. NPDC050536 TaxID=3364366 RepID=UPI0037C8382D